MTHTISATGYEYFTNEDGSTMAVNLKTGEVTEARQAILPVGSWIMTPEDIAAHNERKRQQREFFLQKQAAGQLGTLMGRMDEVMLRREIEWEKEWEKYWEEYDPLY